jgi:hypothetical protein
VHAAKNKLAVSNPDQYKNGKHLRFPINQTQARKGKKDETVHGQRQYAGAPLRLPSLLDDPLFFSWEAHPHSTSNTA